jgi:hypothetical protein
VWELRARWKNFVVFCLCYCCWTDRLLSMFCKFCCNLIWLMLRDYYCIASSSLLH